MATMAPRRRALLLAASALVLGSSSAARKAGSKDDGHETNAHAQAPRKSRRRILSFGGNGMIGSEVVHQLLQPPISSSSASFSPTNDGGDAGDQGYDLVLVSRGSWPFDSDERIAPHVQSIICDRKSGISNCPELTKEIKSTREYYAVLDFSAYRPKWVQEAVDMLQNKARVYVYVSTDSVYEVTESPPYSAESKRRSMETDAVRPSDDTIREELNGKDRYGDRKFAGEEVLYAQSTMPHVSLRFADVVGPRDSTGRFVTYYAWLRFERLKSVPNIAVPRGITEATSITYVGDAAQSILVAMDESNRGAWNASYNIACEEVFNVTSQIMSMGHLMGNHKIRPAKIRNLDLHVYPSVTKGPIDVTKAKVTLGFRPTPQEVALSRTIRWYDKLYKGDSEFRKEVETELIGILDEMTDYESDDDRRDVIDSMLAEVRKQKSK
jgi:nucleoside-diphosphate-sugar epimerase